MDFGTDFGGSGGGIGVYGITLPVGSPQKRTPTKEYVASGPYWLGPKLLHTLPDAVEELSAELGPHVYRAMATDATVKSAVGSLRLGMLDGGISLTSPVKMPPKPVPSARPKPMPGAKPLPGEDPIPTPPSGLETTPEQDSAQETLDFCRRCVDRLGEDFTAQLYAMTQSMEFGVKLAEVVYEVPADGPDKGRLVPKCFKVKPNWAWRFLVDSSLNVKGILTWDVTTGGYVVVDPDKFAWMTWMPEDSDPRGTSILRAAYTAWNLKVQTWQQIYAHNSRFGSPGVDMEMAPGDTAERQPLDSAGNVVPAGPDAPPVAAEQYMMQAIAFYKNGGSLVHPNGSKVGVFESRGDGSAMRASIEMWDRQICLAIEYQARVTLEAKNGSKADSQTSQDTKGLVNSYGRTNLSGVVRKVLRNAVRLNYGDDRADRETPLVSLGESDKHDMPSLVTSLATAGYSVSPSQMQALDAVIPGMPVRDPEEDARVAADMMKLQQQFAPKPEPGAGPPARGDKPPPKGAK